MKFLFNSCIFCSKNKSAKILNLFEKKIENLCHIFIPKKEFPFHEGVKEKSSKKVEKITQILRRD
jgi:hypothetical protein